MANKAVFKSGRDAGEAPLGDLGWELSFVLLAPVSASTPTYCHHRRRVRGFKLTQTGVSLPPFS